MWLESNDLLLITAIIATAIGFVAVIVFNVAYFAYVLPYMRRRRGITATTEAVFGVAHWQVFEYCRLARDGISEKHRKVALTIKLSLTVCLVAFVTLGILFLIRL